MYMYTYFTHDCPLHTRYYKLSCTERSRHGLPTSTAQGAGIGQPL